MQILRELKEGDRVLIAHNDEDGLLSVALFYKFLREILSDNEIRKTVILFSSSLRLIQNIARSILMIRQNECLKNLCIFDIVANQKSLKIAQVYDNVLWIDHHEWPDFDPKTLEEAQKSHNITIIKNESASSTTEIISEITRISNEKIIRVIKEIEKNNITSKEAQRIHEIVTYCKEFLSIRDAERELRRLAKDMATEDINVVFEERYTRFISRYRRYLKSIEQIILNKTRVIKYGKLKVALIIDFPKAPISWIVEVLKKHEKAPFHIILAGFRTNRGIHFEFRSHLKYPIMSLIGRSLKANGSEFSCGATIKTNSLEYATEWILRLIKKNINMVNDDESSL